MLYYTICPHCGYKLLKAEDGAKLEIICPKCKRRLSVIVKNGTIVVGNFSLGDAIDL